MAENESFPILHTRGSYYDVGYSIGNTFDSRIKSYLHASDLTQSHVLPFYESREGRDIVNEILAITKTNFPQYIEEMQGTAEGAGVPFEHIFLNNMVPEIYFGYSRCVPKLTKEDLGCSTVYVNNPDVKVIGHNEDGEKHVKKYGYMASVEIRDETFRKIGTCDEEKFTSFCYPGVLPGMASSFNSYGLVFTLNTLVANKTPKTTPADVVTRAMMSASGIDDVVHILSNKEFGCGSGFNVNIGSVNTDDVWSVEVFPDEDEAKVSVKAISCEAGSYYFHMNNYRHSDFEEPQTGRSWIKFQRALEFPFPTSIGDVKAIVGDTANQEYPIYRTPRPTDDCTTISSFIFDLLNRRMDVYFQNPANGKRPLLSLPII